MLFNSYEFIFAFLPITFFIYFYLNSKRLATAGKGFLVFASLFFYSWWNIIYLPLILGSMLFNFVVGSSLTIESEHKKIDKKTLLIFGIILNIALLGYFKYSDFFIENFNLAFSTNVELLKLVLPLGISFFTFTQIAYLVDSYRGETKEYDLLNYGLFVTFFPHLLAGPILHHKEMMPQFASKWNLVKNYKNIAVGLFIFSIGLFKKVVIADTFAVWAANGFDKAEVLNFMEAWATSLSYTFQIYFDFSGYTDMAIGAALLFNIKLPINFNSPYKALSIQDFWRKWHITLSRFLRDYVYIPLGGNRKGNFRTYGNLFATFVIGGIWHGAGWTFVFWGFLHGIALVVHRFWSGFNFKMSKFVAWFVTFNFINITWVFFRAKEWDDAMKVLKGMFFGTMVLPIDMQKFFTMNITYSNAWLSNINADKYIMIELTLALVIVLLRANTLYIHRNFSYNIYTIAIMILLTVISVLNLSGVHEFLYFNF